jgi:hypothetical protein
LEAAALHHERKGAAGAARTMESPRGHEEGVTLAQDLGSPGDFDRELALQDEDELVGRMAVFHVRARVGHHEDVVVRIDGAEVVRAEGLF